MKIYNSELYVYCTDCVHFRIQHDTPDCEYEDRCDISDCEDSKMIKYRPFYEKKGE